MTAGLLRAEWLKLRRMGITWILIALPTLLAFLGSLFPALGLADSVRRFGSGVLGNLEAYAFPKPMLFGLQLIDFLGSVLIVIFATNIVGNEYVFDTWKNLLTRRAGRGRFMATKVFCLLAGATAIVIIAPIAFQIGIMIAFKSALGVNVSLDATPGEMQELINAAAVSWLRLAVAASIGLLTTVVTRSGGGGIALAMPWLVADGILSNLVVFGGVWRDLAPYTFSFNLNALSAYLGGGAGSVTLAHSLVMLWIYTFGFAALAVAVFRRRDIAG